jgi:hypothetical protein
MRASSLWAVNFVATASHENCRFIVGQDRDLAHDPLSIRPPVVVCQILEKLAHNRFCVPSVAHYGFSLGDGQEVAKGHDGGRAPTRFADCRQYSTVNERRESAW